MNKKNTKLECEKIGQLIEGLNENLWRGNIKVVCERQEFSHLKIKLLWKTLEINLSNVKKSSALE